MQQAPHPLVSDKIDFEIANRSYSCCCKRHMPRSVHCNSESLRAAAPAEQLDPTCWAQTSCSVTPRVLSPTFWRVRSHEIRVLLCPGWLQHALHNLALRKQMPPAKLMHEGLLQSDL